MAPDGDSAERLQGELAELRARLRAREELLSRALLEKGEMLLQQMEESRTREHRARELSRSDPVTGLLRHGAFRERLIFEVERSRRTEQPLGLLVLDLDRFGEVTRERGYREAERLLGSVGRALEGPWLAREGPRPPVLARDGADSFAVLLPAADRAEVADRAEDLRSLVERLPLPGGVRLTCSTGVVAAAPGAADASEIYGRACALVAKARGQGGNRIELESLG